MNSEPQEPNTPPTIHYPWIGPPPGERGVAGHDVADVKVMAKQNQNNPIVFWCLDAHKEHYEQAFQEHSNIQVKTVEALVDEHKNNPQLAARAEKMEQLMNDYLSENKNSVRDRVTIKNLFSAYILMTEGGYVMDTNVNPSSATQEINLPQKSGFAMAGFEDRYGDITPDCFLMYSDSNEQNQTKLQSAFDKYAEFLNAEETEMNRGKEGYNLSMGRKFLSELTKAGPSYFIGTQGFCRAEFEELHLTKFFYNTHKFFNAELPMIFNNIMMNYNANLSVMLNNGANPNYQFTTPVGENRLNSAFNASCVTNITPLHCAIAFNNTAAVQELLKAGADPNLKATLNTHHAGPEGGNQPNEMTALDLARKLGNTDIIDLLEKVTQTTVVAQDAHEQSSQFGENSAAQHTENGPHSNTSQEHVAALKQSMHAEIELLYSERQQNQDPQDQPQEHISPKPQGG